MRTIDVVSFPKSGKTWLRFMVGSVLAEISGEPFERVQRAMMPTGESLAWWPDGLPLPVFSHGDYRPGGTFPADRYAGRDVVRLVRDPRDVVASHYFHERFGMCRFEGSLDEFVRRVPTPDEIGTNRDLWGAWAAIDFMAAWHRAATSFGRDTLVRYEQVRTDPEGELATLLAALGISATPGVVRRAVEACEIDRMRALEQTGDFKHLGLQGSTRQEGNKVRAGIVGGHRTHLTNEQIAYIEGLIASTLPAELRPAELRPTELRPAELGPAESVPDPSRAASGASTITAA